MLTVHAYLAARGLPYLGLRPSHQHQNIRKWTLRLWGHVWIDGNRDLPIIV